MGNYQSYLYFIATRDNKYLKIGHSSNPKTRIKAIQNGCPIKVYMALCVPFESKNECLNAEKSAHCKWASKRLTGEWFRLDGELLDLISDNIIDTPKRKEYYHNPIKDANVRRILAGERLLSLWDYNSKKPPMPTSCIIDYNKHGERVYVYMA